MLPKTLGKGSTYLIAFTDGASNPESGGTATA
jgi:hypothetical protein